MSEAVTQGVRIVVKVEHLDDESTPYSSQYAFAYHVRITNEGLWSVKLLSRHWVIMNGHGKVEEVRGEGVVGVQPVLRAGESFDYTSGCMLRTPYGTMHGTFQMESEEGETFDAHIAPFMLAVPGTLN